MPNIQSNILRRDKQEKVTHNQEKKQLKENVSIMRREVKNMQIRT